MRLFIILILFFASFSTFGQEKDWEKRTVGFACGISENSTPLVDKMTDLVNNKKYSEISSFLNSKIGGEIYLAILILERLDKMNIYQISEEQKILIKRLKAAPIPVENCLGCFTETDFMNKIFKEENFIGEDYWLNEILPIE